ncbi:MAG: EI24 domain-containing protein [Desulfococcaceae bacterium]
MFLKELFAGLRAYGKARRVIISHKLWPWMLIPGFMSFGYLLLLVWAGSIWMPDLSAYVTQNWIPAFLKRDTVVFLTHMLLWILFLLTGYVTLQPVILILFSPVLSYVSEITECRIYGRPSLPLNLKHILQDILRSIVINLRNLLRMVIFVLIAWMLMIIPLIGSLLSFALIFLIQSFYNGFSMSDYTLERKRWPVAKRITYSKENRSRIIGVGMGFTAILMIPVLGWFIAPTCGTVAATIATLEKIHPEDSVLKKL